MMNAHLTLRHFATADGVTIAADQIGEPSQPTAILMHGGGQTRHSWGAATKTLGAAGFCALNLDLRGHGDSSWAPDGNYRLDAFVDDLRSIMRTLPQPPALIGASMGGLTALLAIGESAEPLARALVLVDITPNINMEGAKEIGDFMKASPNGFASLDEAAAAVSKYLPHRPRPTSTRGLLKNLRLRDDGRYYWHWDPKMISGDRSSDPSPLINRLEAAARNIKVPTLLIRGGLSRVVSMESVGRFRELMPHAEFANIEHADHMVAGDRNDAFNAPLIEFLQRHR